MGVVDSPGRSGVGTFDGDASCIITGVIGSGTDDGDGDVSCGSNSVLVAEVDSRFFLGVFLTWRPLYF